MSPKFENIILQTTSSLVEECLLSNNEDIKLLNERLNNLPIELSDSVFQQLKFFDYLYEIMGISEMTPLYEITKKLNSHLILICNKNAEKLANYFKISY